MNKRIQELAEQAELRATLLFNKENLGHFAELIVRETINEMIGQLWNYGIDESNNPSFYKAVERTKEHFGVEE
jgi:hypothetical protein